ncbi:unnamed protein product [Staurois parvus]|uniref:Uncharacterized protein n=1 Tax=Staurois parvus TaxID=386267 RepID=A0ABN9D0L7_9NEOB|nr:unnamed protein product [Staurois parvus]
MENPRRSVRRPQSGTWQSGSNWEAVQDPGHTVGPAGKRDRRYGGPWPIWGLAGTNGRPVICQQPMTKWNKPQGV